MTLANTVKIDLKDDSALESFPDDQCLKAFKGFLEKWPRCPLCEGRFGFHDVSRSPSDLDQDYSISCLSRGNKHHFSAGIKHKYRKSASGQVYVKKVATFAMRAGDYSINWNSITPETIYAQFSVGMFETRKLKLKFGSFDKWFVSEKQVRENIDKLRILL